tara:strand:+ start:5691 stop:7700 length:2010 start_codon:yes stop_codon:yes gene_type:complete
METGFFDHQGKKKKTIYDADLNLDRTTRIYKTLNNLSNDSVHFLKSGELKEFSFSADRMRPLMAYINDNKVLISKHLNNDEFQASNQEAAIREFSANLTENLRTINKVQETMNEIEFSPVFFLSDPLINAYLDNQIPLSWEFHHDLVLIINLDNRKIIDTLIERGQKRIFLLNGLIDVTELADNNSYPDDVVIHKLEDHEKIREFIMVFKTQPPRRFLALDCGSKKSDAEIMDDIKFSLERGREAAWIRFNTLNRGDAVKILDNLNNIVKVQQTAEFHKKFEGHSAIIVCPGPSLAKNIDTLKEAKGKILIICVLHAFRALKKAGITPDIVIHTDPFSLKNLYFERDGQEKSQWDEWIESNDFSDVRYFITSSMGSPSMFNIPTKKILWMSPGQKVGAHLPIDVYDYNRVGGSVSHSAFDLMVEFGFKSIALVGQDLAFGSTGEMYADHAHLDMSEKRLKGMGERFEVKGFYGDNVETNNTFYFFGQSYEMFARELKESGINLFNCTEGGMYLEGFEHCSLKEFISSKKKNSKEEEISSIFSNVENSHGNNGVEKKAMRQYVSKNMSLGNEIASFIEGAMDIVNKKDFSEHKLAKFDKLQNKVIRKMKRNYFFELGLQRELYMLQSGLGADKSLDGQLAFHMDFLSSAKKFNTKFRKALKEQFRLLNDN